MRIQNLNSETIEREKEKEKRGEAGNGQLFKDDLASEISAASHRPV